MNDKQSQISLAKGRDPTPHRSGRGHTLRQFGVEPAPWRNSPAIGQGPS